MHGLWQDFRYAARGFGRNPGITVIMVFTLALAIGAATAIFSVVYGVLLRPLPYAGADRIMAISEVNSHGRRSRLADPNFDDFRDQSHSFQSIAKYSAYPSFYLRSVAADAHHSGRGNAGVSDRIRRGADDGPGFCRER